MDLSAFPTAGALASSGTRAPRWQPGLAGARHSEVFGAGAEASGVGAALALLLDGFRAEDTALAGRSWLWVQDAAALRLGGRPYRAGLPAALRCGLIHVAVRKVEDALFALEEGLRCRDLAGVIGEVAGNPKALDFTASRRLSLAAERYGIPLFLVRLDAAPDLSSARMRWRVSSAASPAPRWNAQAPGAPTWHAELFRSRAHAPGEWTLTDGEHGLAAKPVVGSPRDGDLAAAAGDRSLAAF